MQISTHANYMGQIENFKNRKHTLQVDNTTAIMSWISRNARTLLLSGDESCWFVSNPGRPRCSACTESRLSRCTQWMSSGSLRSCTTHAPTRALALSFRNSCTETARCCVSHYLWRVKKCEKNGNKPISPYSMTDNNCWTVIFLPEKVDSVWKFMGLHTNGKLKP